MNAQAQPRSPGTLVAHNVDAGIRATLKSERFGFMLNALALALLAALLARAGFDYSPEIFGAAALPSALALLALSIASLAARRTNKSVLDFLLAAASLAALGALPSSEPRPSPPPTAIPVPRVSPVEVVHHPLPGDARLFRDGFDKSGWKSFSDLTKAAGSYHARWRADLLRQGFSEDRARVISYMLFTSTLWAFGNEHRPEKVGCIPRNEDNNWQHAQPSLAVVKQARIGCCNDYAYALSLILSQHGIENRYVFLPGHVFNEVKVGGTWQVLDASTNIFINASWSDAISDRPGTSLRVFPHPGQGGGRLHRAALGPFQEHLVNAVRSGKSAPGTVRAGRMPDPGRKITVHALY